MVELTRKLDIISLGILKLMGGCLNSYNLDDFSNLLNEDVTFHIINKAGLKWC